MNQESRISNTKKMQKVAKRFSACDSYPMLRNSGFTLIEMMVATSIFAMVMLMAVGALLSIVDTSRKAQSQETSFVNLDFALETMSRSIRLGTSYHCSSAGDITKPNDKLTGCSYLVFEAFNGSSANPNDQIVYRLNGTRIERSVNSGSAFIPLTSPDVVVQNLFFYVTGAATTSNPDAATDPTNSLQPRVLITANGYAGTGKSQVSFNLQTTVTQRLLDL